jgi:chloramphenicol O-acetyltransferase type A
MSSKTKIELDSWNRKEHFLFYKQMEEPFYGLTTRIDCTKAYDKAKQIGVSFFIYYLHQTLTAINTCEPFRLRIIEHEPWLFEQINASATIMREDQTFGFSLIEFHPELSEFNCKALQEINRVQNTIGLFTREFPNENLIHFSSIPWVDFSGLSHARGFSYPDSCPKISFGKMIEEKGRKTMALSIHVHHGLVDGVHIGQFLDTLQQLFDS